MPKPPILPPTPAEPRELPAGSGVEDDRSDSSYERILDTQLRSLKTALLRSHQHEVSSLQRRHSLLARRVSGRQSPSRHGDRFDFGNASVSDDAALKSSVGFGVLADRQPSLAYGSGDDPPNAGLNAWLNADQNGGDKMGRQYSGESSRSGRSGAAKASLFSLATAEDDEEFNESCFAADQVTVVDRWAALVWRLQSLAELLSKPERILHMHKGWSIAGVHEPVHTHPTPISPPASSVLRKQNTHGRMNDIMRDNNCLNRFVVHPENVLVIAWKMLAVLMISWDLITIPLQQFELGEHADYVLGFAGTLTFSYWVADCPLTFITGIDKQSGVEMRIKEIAVQYAITWLIPDLFVLSIDVFLFVMDTLMSSSQGDALKSVRLIRALRMLRLLRLIRVVKLQTVIAVFANRFMSHYGVLLLKLLSGLGLILTVNHFIACFWLGIGLSAYGESWLDRAGLRDSTFTDGYVASLHWSLTQFTPATNNLSPANVGERLFSVVVILLAMAVFSSFVSTLTNAVNSMRVLRKERMQQESTLRTFFTERNLSTDLFVRVREHCNRSGLFEPKLLEKQVAILKELPESLKVTLHEEMYMPILLSRPWILDNIPSEGEMLVKVCHRAMSERTVAPNHDAFNPGDAAHEVLILQSGDAIYQRMMHETTKVCNGSALAELCIWAEWMHVGQLTSAATCHYVVLDTEHFIELVGRTRGWFFKYLQTFGIMLLSLLEEEEWDDALSDLPIDSEILEGLASRAYRIRTLKSAGGSLQQL